MLREQVNETTRVARGMCFGSNPYLVQVEALTDVGWSIVRWETFPTRHERDARFEALCSGLREGHFGIYYKEFPRFAFIQQRSMRTRVTPCVSRVSRCT